MRRSFLILLLLLPIGLRAQERTFTVSADYLTRGEVRDGGAIIPEEGEKNARYDARFLLGRTRLTVDYSQSWLTTRLSAQHAGAWGSSDASNLTMYEAWVEMRSPRVSSSRSAASPCPMTTSASSARTTGP